MWKQLKLITLSLFLILLASSCVEVEQETDIVFAGSGNSPVISNLIVTSSSGTNTSNESWTATFTVTDAEGDPTFNTSWYNTSTKKPLAIYDFGVDNVTDVVNGRNGAKQGSGMTWINTSTETYYDFNGAGGVLKITNADSWLDGLSALTVITKIKSDVTNSDKGWLIVENPVGDDSSITMRYDASGASGGCSNCMKLAVQVGASDQQVETSTNSQTTSDQCVAMTWSSGNAIKVYLDGTEDTLSYIGTPQTGTVNVDNDLFIGLGGKGTIGSSGWNGRVYWVRMYDYVMSQEQITNICNGYHNLSYQETSDNEDWTFNVISSDGNTYSSKSTYDFHIISQTVPTTPTSLQCDDGNCNTTFTSNIELNCTGSTDAEGDTITYFIEKGNDTGLIEGEVRNGNYGTGSVTDGFYANQWYIGKGIIVNETGSVNSTSVRFYEVTAPNSCKMAIYDDSNNLLGSSEEQTVSSAGWNHFIYNLSVNVTKGNLYKVIVWCDGNFNEQSTGYTASSGTWYANSQTYEATWEDPIVLTYYDTRNVYFYMNISYLNQTYDYTVVGNHAEGNIYTWDISSEPDETYEKMRCRAIDLNGSNTYSDYYTISTNLTIDYQAAPPPTGGKASIAPSYLQLKKRWWY